MTARQKIEGLTNSWYGFEVFQGALLLLTGGFGFFSLLRAAFWVIPVTLLQLLFVFFLGRRLLAKSAIWRTLLLCASAILTVTSTLGAGKAVMTFFGDWSFSLLLEAALLAVHVVMYVRSFSVLTDSSVKTYFN